jgi:hypothetical protein
MKIIKFLVDNDDGSFTGHRGVALAVSPAKHDRPAYIYLLSCTGEASERVEWGCFYICQDVPGQHPLAIRSIDRLPNEADVEILLDGLEDVSPE